MEIIFSYTPMLIVKFKEIKYLTLPMLSEKKIHKIGRIDQIVRDYFDANPSLNEIAHELQETLETINSLSKENANLVQELKQELASLNIPSHQQQTLTSIVGNLIQNQQEVTEKGHQANVIVKDMLEHSGKTLGEDSLLI